jgi:segregation and condensation protein B
MTEERPDSLAAQAASWVPPWERAQRPPDAGYAAATRSAAGDDERAEAGLSDGKGERAEAGLSDGDGERAEAGPPDDNEELAQAGLSDGDEEPAEAGPPDDEDDFDSVFEGPNPAEGGTSVPPEVPSFPEEANDAATVDAPQELPGEVRPEPTEINGGPELPLPEAVEEAAEHEIGRAPMVDAPLPPDGDDAGDVFDAAADDDVADDSEVDLPFTEIVPGPDEDDDDPLPAEAGASGLGLGGAAARGADDAAALGADGAAVRGADDAGVRGSADGAGVRGSADGAGVRGSADDAAGLGADDGAALGGDGVAALGAGHAAALGADGAVALGAGDVAGLGADDAAALGADGAAGPGAGGAVAGAAVAGVGLAGGGVADITSEPVPRARPSSGIPAQGRRSKGAGAASGAASSRTEKETETKPAAIDDGELRAALEAILLVVDEPVAEMQLAQIMEQPTERVAAMLEDISARYTAAGHGFDLRRAAGGWRLYTRPEYAAYVERFVLDGQSVRLTQAALETLAVVAYKQPVTRSRISAIRGVNCDGVMRTLNTRGLIEECGTESETGAFLYRTTALFLEKLGLNSVDQLPPLAPFLPDDVEEVLDASG